MDPVRQVLQLYLNLTPEQLVQFHELLRVLGHSTAQQAAVQPLSQARIQSPIQPPTQSRGLSASQPRGTQAQTPAAPPQDVAMTGDDQSSAQFATTTVERPAHTLPQDNSSAPKIKPEPASASSIAGTFKQAPSTSASTNPCASSSNTTPTTKRNFSAFEADVKNKDGSGYSQPPVKASRPLTGFGAASTFPPPTPNRDDDHLTPASPNLFMEDTVGSSGTETEDRKSAGFHSRMNIQNRAQGVSRREHTTQMTQQKQQLKANSAEASENKANSGFVPEASMGVPAVSKFPSAQAPSMPPPLAPKNGFHVDTAAKITPLFNFVGPNAGTPGTQQKPQQASQQTLQAPTQKTSLFAPTPVLSTASAPQFKPAQATPSGPEGHPAKAWSPFTRSFETTEDDARRRSEASLFNSQAPGERPARGAFRGQRGRGQMQGDRGNRGDRGGRGG